MCPVIAHPGFNGGGAALGNDTPVMDRLANEGLILTSAYSTPSCSPTRATIHTGQNPLQHGILRPPRTHYVTPAERGLDPKIQPGASEELLAPGSAQAPTQARRLHPKARPTALPAVAALAAVHQFCQHCPYLIVTECYFACRVCHV
jgi:hypothetical protein